MSEPLDRAVEALEGLIDYPTEAPVFARAAILAIREPTPEMIKLGQEAIDKGMSASYVWRLLIEVVLK